MAAERRAVILGPHDRAAAVEAKSRDPERRRTLAGTDGSNTLVIEPAYDDSWAVPLAPWWFAEYVPMRRDVWATSVRSAASARRDVPPSGPPRDLTAASKIAARSCGSGT